MDNITALKSQHPALYKHVVATLRSHDIEEGSADGVRAITAMAERTALVKGLRVFSEPPYSNFPEGSQGQVLRDAKKDEVLKAIADQESVLADYGLV